MSAAKFATSPILKVLPPGFQRILNYTMHVAKIPGLKHDGYDITFIHGIAAAAATWMPLIRHLIPHARKIIAFDMPGHGLSADPIPPFSCEDAYNAVCECLIKNLDPTHRNLIVANSLGGGFALKFALENPNLVQRLVLISPAGAPFPTTAHELIDWFEPSNLEEAANGLKKVFAFPTKKAYLLTPVLRYYSARPGFKSLMKSIKEIDSNPDCNLRALLYSPQELADFHTPTLLIWGDRDMILPRQMRDFFDAHLPDSTTRLFPSNFGHCPQFEQPAELAYYISDWLNTSATP